MAYAVERKYSALATTRCHLNLNMAAAEDKHKKHKYVIDDIVMKLKTKAIKGDKWSASGHVEQARI